MVRNVYVCLLLMPTSHFYLSFKNIVSTASTVSGENVRKEQCLGCEHSVLVWDMFWFSLQNFVNFEIYSWTQAGLMLQFLHEVKVSVTLHINSRCRLLSVWYYLLSPTVEEPLLQDIWCQEKCHFSRIRRIWVKLHVFLHLTLEGLKMFQERNLIFRI